MPAFSGIRSMIEMSGPKPLGVLRAAPFGVPVVPEVRMIVRPCLRGTSSAGGRGVLSTRRTSSLSLIRRMLSGRSSVAAASSSSWMIAVISCCSATTASWGPARPVLPSTRSMPMAEAPHITSIARAWLRASSMTFWPEP